MSRQQANRPTNANYQDLLVDFKGWDFSQFGGEQTQPQEEEPKEAAANRFAAEMIMPRDAVRFYVNKGYSLGSLAALFAVSEHAMSIRLERLGLISGV